MGQSSITASLSSSKQRFISKLQTQEDIQTAIRNFLSVMSLNEKLGQLQQVSYDSKQISPQFQKAIIDGQVGSCLNARNLDVINNMQIIAMQKSKLKIPILVGRDVIHGYRTIFPIPLGQAASFNPLLIEKGSRIAAIQCSSVGIRWTFTPMVDIARDPRWGRIAEGFGQDPYLTSVMGVAVLNGFQTKNLKDETAVAACGKHYVGYGAAQGGRDYNTTLIPENTLRDIYLPPFQALCKNNCLTYMSGFNDLNGEPATANQFTLKKILRNEWGFKGLVVSDWQSILQLINHGFAQNEMQAAEKSFNAGIDMEMSSATIRNNFENLLSKKLVTLKDLDEKVGNCLRVKFKLNLFQNYYTDPLRQKIILNPAHKQAAKNLALQCPVLLQNKNQTLPIDPNIQNLAIVGSLANDPENQIGCWAWDSSSKDSITPLTSLRASLPHTNITFSKGYKTTTSMDKSYFPEALNNAALANKIVLFLGEDNDLSGESHCRSNIDLPGVQYELLMELSKLGKPIVVIIYAGRSLVLEPILKYVDSILFSWHLGTMTGPAIADLLLGVVSPSGKLPVTFLRSTGQIPLYYNKKNTGAPNQTHQYIPYTSCYVDLDPTPLFPFGFGLSYSTFQYLDMKISKSTLRSGSKLTVSASIKNVGKIKADQIVFLFIRDLVGSYTRPIKQLKGFQRITLLEGQKKDVSFEISSDNLKFWTMDKVYKAQSGKFNVWIGRDSSQGLMETFSYIESDLTQSQQIYEQL